MLGRLMSPRCGHCLVSSSEGMLRLEAFNLSTVHSLCTSILSVPSRGSTVKLISVPNLGLFSISWVVRKNAFCWPWIPSSVARFLSHRETSDPAYVSTVLLKSFLRTLTWSIRRQTLPTLAEELLVWNSGCTSIGWLRWRLEQGVLFPSTALNVAGFLRQAPHGYMVVLKAIVT